MTNATDVMWAAEMANGIRESILAEAMAVEEDSGHDVRNGQHDVANGIAALSVAVSDCTSLTCVLLRRPPCPVRLIYHSPILEPLAAIGKHQTRALNALLPQILSLLVSSKDGKRGGNLRTR